MKKQILDMLKREKGFISGEELSNRLGVSRTAVWKHINELRKDGYNIESFSKKGYRLRSAPDLLDERELEVPEGQKIGSQLIHFDEIDSTNNYAKKIGNEGCPHGTVVIAERQTSGRGRVGREWKSDNSQGLWFSIVLRPVLVPEEVQIVTLAASVAVVEGIRDGLGIDCGIKWPNDIILEGCKLAGILTELSAEPGHVNYVVVGIGMNVNQDQGCFEDEIKGKATSLKIHTGEAVSRVKLLGCILTRFEEVYGIMLQGGAGELIERWERYSVTIGREVRVLFREKEYIGTARSIAKDGRLIVKCTDGEVREISAGEVQVRGLLGYT